jgi:outer membrane autotransporter protein
MKSKASKNRKLSQKILCSILAASVLGITGSAFAATHTEKWVVNGEIIANKVTTTGYNMEDLQAGAEITDSQFLNNEFTGTDVYGGVFRVMNKKNPDQIVTVNNTVFNGNISSVNKNNTWALGGAIMIKGATTTFTDVDFDNNKIIGEGDAVQVGGGAVYVDAVRNKDVVKPEGNANVTFKVTKDMAYTGNTIQAGDNGQNWYDTYGGLAQSKGGFLFIDRDAEVAFDIQNNATLTIGNVNASDNNEDTIASVIPYVGNDVDFAKIVKTGDGTLTINSSLNDYYGLLDINAGTLNVNKDWTVRNAVTLASGANVNLTDVTLDKISGTINSYNSSITAQKDYTVKEAVGSITTAEGSVFNAGNVVMKDGTSITAAGEVNISKGLMMEAGSKAELSGGGAVTAANGENTAVYANGSGTSFTSNNVDFTGAVSADNNALVTINGGTITASDYYAEGQLDGLTEINSSNGGTLTVNNTQINSHVAANGGTTVINNSNIASPDGIDVMKGGTLQLNGSADNTYTVTNYILVTDDNSKLEINGGKLIAENLRDLTSYTDAEGTVTSKDGGIVLQGKGVIETKGDQIFERGVDVSSDEAVIASTSGDVTNNAISYVGGTLSLTDEKYSLGYVKSAKNSLTEYQKYSKTGIVMTGTLVGGTGEENTISVGDAASIGDDIALDKVTATSANNLIVGVVAAPTDNVEGISVETAVNNGFSVAALDITSKDGVNTNGVVITDGENVTLGGSAGGELITVDDTYVTDASTLKVVVGTTSDVNGATEQAGSLTIGNALATSNTSYTLTGSVTVNNDSTLNVNGQTYVKGGVELNSGSVNVGNGTLVSDITAKGNTSITGTAKVGTLTGAADTVINVGNKTNAGNVTVETADLQGATVFLDPTWLDGAEITDASKMAVAGENAKVTLNGNYVVGENSVMSFGVDNNEKAQETFAKTGLTWGKDAITAGLYINGSVNVADGAIVVDGSKTEAPDTSYAPANGTFTAADNSVVMVDGTAITGTNDAAIAGATTVTVEETSKLYIDGAKKGETYHVIDGVDTDGWADANIVSDNALLVFNGDGTTGDSKFDVTAKYQSVNNVYGDNAVVIDSVVDKTLEVKKEGDKAFDFFNDAVNYKNNATKAAQVEALNSVANMGELAGVNHGTYSMSNAMTDAVAHHLSLATHGEQDKDIWAHYIHNKEDIDGMDFGGVDGSYEAQYNGIVVGSDLYKNGKTTAGIALSYADGNINGSNIASSTKNDAEYYGASLYGRIDNGDSAILGDISYMHSDNDITQNNSGHEITASADADAFSIGIRAEQAYKAGAGKFVPYAGIRYMHLGAGDYSNSLGMEYNADDQNLWLLPVGVTYSAEVQSGDWTVKPIAEVGYVWTMGDRDTDQTVSLNGASDTFGFETADSGSFIGRLGIEAEKADVTYGLSYEYQKGDTVKANKWMANLTWSF